MSIHNSTTVAIVGGGPVGLFLGICLHTHKIPFIILEEKPKPVQHSRSLGIHPVSLDLFKKYNIHRAFLEHGLAIKSGIALSGNGRLGAVDFSKTDAGFPFILSCPQYKTEELLEKHLLERSPDCLIRSSRFKTFESNDSGLKVFYETKKQNHSISADFIVGCDGKNSNVRECAGIPFVGGSYPDVYVMGDFTDNTSFGSNAAVYLPKKGLIESFPLPNGQRRWVLKTETYIQNPTPEFFASEIKSRIGFDISTEKNSMLNSFGVQHFMAERFVSNRVCLAGDAAHVVSPIGGQGMNLGWIDAHFLALTLREKNPDAALLRYAKKQKKMAETVAARAQMNMMLGRKYRFPFFRNMIVKTMLSKLFHKKTVALFTMRGLF